MAAENRVNPQWLQYYTAKPITLARTSEVVSTLTSCDHFFRIKKTNPYLYLRCALYFESLLGPNSRALIEAMPRAIGSADNSIHVSEFILGDIQAQAIHDVVGSAAVPQVFPEFGHTGIAFESRDMADGLEISVHLNGTGVKGRWAFAWKALSRERMSMEEWKEAVQSVNCDSPTAYDLGSLT